MELEGTKNNTSNLKLKCMYNMSLSQDTRVRISVINPKTLGFLEQSVLQVHTAQDPPGPQPICRNHQISVFAISHRW